MHEPLSGEHPNQDSSDEHHLSARAEGPSDPVLARLHDSEISRLAYQACDGTPEDYCRKLFEFAEVLGSLRGVLADFLQEHGLELTPTLELIEQAVTAEHEAQANSKSRGGTRGGAGDIKSSEAKDLIRHLHFHSLDPAAIAAASGCAEADVRHFIERANYSPHAVQVVELWNSGERNITAISRATGLSRTRVYQLLEAAGIQVRNLTPPDQKARIIRAYQGGHEVKDIMAAEGLSKSRVQSVLRRAATRGEVTYPRGR